MICEIVNMSDPVSFKAPDFKTAAAVVLLLGNGQYGLEHDGPDKLPMLFGVGDFIDETWPDGMAEWLNGDHGPSVIEALRSTAVVVRSAYPPRTDNIEAWNEAHRSSLNDICGRARRLAAAMEGKREGQPLDPREAAACCAPVQVFVR